MQDFLEMEFWNNTVQDYLIALGALAASIIVILVFKRILLRRLTAWVETTPTSLDDMIVNAVRKYLLPLLYIGVVYLNTKWLTLPDDVVDVMNIAIMALLTIFGALVVSSLAIYLFNKYIEKKQQAANKAAIRWIGILIKAVIWIGALLLFLDNLDVKITTLVAGLGIGGIAIAFAAQAILEDIFSFVTIFFDRPFEIDDFIIVDDLAGTVEHIGIKTTRLRSLSGEQLIFSNKDLTNTRLHNYKRMQERRIQFTLGVTYDTPAAKLREIPGMLQEAIKDIEFARFDRAHFKEFADFSMNFEVVYFVLSEDYSVYMDVQQAINFAVKDVFDAHGIEFAFPTQTLYLEK